MNLEERKPIYAIFARISLLASDFDWAGTVTDELFIYQPFLLSMLMGYQFDLSASELEEALVLYTAVWEHYKVNPKVKNKAVTETRFDHFHDNYMRERIENESGTVLLAVILERFASRPVLRRMEIQTKAALVTGIKSRIACFEELIKK